MIKICVTYTIFSRLMHKYTPAPLPGPGWLKLDLYVPESCFLTI